MLLRTTAIAAIVLSVFVNPAFACKMRETKAEVTTQTVDPIKTASMVMAAPVVKGDMTIDGYWIKAMLPGQPVAGGFLSITNKSADGDTLISASSPKSGRMELHEMVMKGDVMEMRALKDGIAIPAGSTVELAPGGLHLMLFEVAEAFKEGDTVAVTLTFEKAGQIELMLPVLAKAMSH